jgi:hypothetical protein
MVRWTRSSGRTLLFAALAIAVVTPHVRAAEGRIPLWTQVGLGPGSTPGKYIVTRDIFAVAGSGLPAISIAGGPGFEEIDIDLNGFTVYGDPGGAPVISATGLVSLTIRNGSVRHFAPAGNGIEVFAVEKAVIEDTKVSGGVAGIFLSEVPSFAVRRNVVRLTSSDGIFAVGPPPFAGTLAISGVIEDNQVYDAGSSGIGVVSVFSSVTIRGNEVESPGGSGILVSGVPPGPGVFVGSLIVAENTVQEAGGDGIFIRAVRKGKVYNNTVYASGGNGIALVPTTGFLVLDNVSGGNGASGLVVDGAQNHIDRNVLTGNALSGLWFGFASFDNTYGRNTARANGAPAGACAAAPIATCPAPWGPGGTFPPDFCNDGPGNTSFCDNHMPGPPQG